MNICILPLTFNSCFARGPLLVRARTHTQVSVCCVCVARLISLSKSAGSTGVFRIFEGVSCIFLLLYNYTIANMHGYFYESLLAHVNFNLYKTNKKISSSINSCIFELKRIFWSPYRSSSGLRLHYKPHQFINFFYFSAFFHQFFKCSLSIWK